MPGTVGSSSLEVNGVVLERIEHRDGPASTDPLIALFAYELGPAGHRTAVDEQQLRPGGTSIVSRRVEYEYDDLYRLTRETIDEGSSTRDITYTYDLVGNRISRNEDGETNPIRQTYEYTYDKNDRLEVVSAKFSAYGTIIEYDYDDNGNQIRRDADPDSGFGDARYIWDIEGRLVSTDLDDNEDEVIDRTLSFRYNDDGIRVGRTEGLQETEYLVDPLHAYDQVLEEYEGPAGGSLSLAATYMHGLDLISQDRSGTRSYYHADGLGSTRALSDVSGAVTDTYNYDAFGREVGTPATATNDFRFAGEQFDSGLDQYYLRARYYDAAAGRFTSQDPFQGVMLRPLTFNDYVYVHNDPGNQIDPSGMLAMSMAQAMTIGATLTLALGAPALVLYHSMVPLAGADGQLLAVLQSKGLDEDIATDILKRSFRRQDKCFTWTGIPKGLPHPQNQRHVQRATKHNGQTTLRWAAFRLDANMTYPPGPITGRPVQNWIQNDVGHKNDDAGHAVGRQFGGQLDHNGPKGNFYPQHPWFNTSHLVGQRKREDLIRSNRSLGGSDSCALIVPIYNDKLNINRPSKIAYVVMHRIKGSIFRIDPISYELIDNPVWVNNPPFNY